jgi:transcription termination factor Rho
VDGAVLGDGDEAEADVDLPTEEVTGVLELTRQGYGFLRLEGLAPADGDVYISAAQVRRCELRPGDEVSGPARDPRRGERHRALVHVDTVNGEEPSAEARPDFDALAAVQPERRLPLDGAADDVLVRAVDLLTPLAYGQRILVRATPRSGRTTLLRSIARAAASPDTAKVIVLLIDERPEEATAWREELPVAEFAIATADLAPAEQVRTAELALERARRLAESGTDAVLICDSLSRLAFAAGDVAEVKRLFGSGRNLAGGGSLTVVATVLEDGRDEGEAERAVSTTESSLVVLDAELAAAGVFPALRAGESQISNEDRIRDAGELEAARRLRSLLADLEPSNAASLLRERIETTAGNAELLASI